MEQVELDVALEELELRLERLRALYEQYFMGLEKIEPQIARKDIDRRIYVLRREKIRNTAKRFKLQTIIQRYNTFQQYWMRICREIENGTYKRHLIKAAKQSELLTIAARKRLGRHGSRSKPPEAATPSEPPGAQPNAVPAPALAPAPAPAATEALATPAPAAAAAAARPLGPPLPRRPALPSRPGEAAPLAAPPAPAPLAVAPTPIASPPRKPAPAKFESLDLDMDFMGDWDPVAKHAAPKPAAKPAALAAAASPAKPAAAAPVAAPPASIPPAPVAVPPRPASSRPPTAPARPAAPRIAPAARPLGAAPPPKPLAKPATPAPAAASGSVDDARMRDLHARLQQAKQQTKEANISFEGLAKSIRAAEAKLREQHKNRKIDFDVVIKDGKAVVKPIVR